mmetsp:Transcript_43686/g.72773  ORF Transcript_43686/g.72773 Transcript_43686/m.72773 type:complete len:245 (-) Transcript_43686:625-1359(-)
METPLSSQMSDARTPCKPCLLKNALSSSRITKPFSTMRVMAIPASLGHGSSYAPELASLTSLRSASSCSVCIGRLLLTNQYAAFSSVSSWRRLPQAGAACIALARVPQPTSAPSPTEACIVASIDVQTSLCLCHMWDLSPVGQPVRAIASPHLTVSLPFVTRIVQNACLFSTPSGTSKGAHQGDFFLLFFAETASARCTASSTSSASRCWVSRWLAAARSVLAAASAAAAASFSLAWRLSKSAM